MTSSVPEDERPPTTASESDEGTAAQAAATSEPDAADPAAAGGSSGGGEDEAPMTVEAILSDLETVTAERDGYLDTLRRLQAEFENYRKAVAKREQEARERANEGLIGELLPVLDACDAAAESGAEPVLPIRSMLFDTLGKQGLERLDESGVPFDPEQHEAVMHEPSDDGSGPIVAQLLRVGYRWKGRIVRAAMVQVRG